MAVRSLVHRRVAHLRRRLEKLLGRVRIRSLVRATHRSANVHSDVDAARPAISHASVRAVDRLRNGHQRIGMVVRPLARENDRRILANMRYWFGWQL